MKFRSPLRRAGAVVLAASLLLALVMAGGLAALDSQVEHQLSELQAYAAGDTVDRLSLLQRDEGDEPLTRAVQRATDTAAPGQLFLLIDARGQKLAGNLPAWPEEAAADDDWAAFALPDGHTARAITARLPSGAQLLVGQDDRTRRVIRWAILWVAALALLSAAAVLAAAAGFWARSINLRLQNLARGAVLIGEGHRSVRLPVSPQGDAFDALSETLNRMIDDNQRLMAGLETVTHSLAHDLRTPLMRMTAAIADAQLTDDASLRDRRLADAQTAADHAVGVFSGLADLALAQTRLSREAMETVDLDTVVRDLVELFEPAAEDRQQSFTVRSAPLLIAAHRQLLMQAIANLLENAVKYAPPGTEIRVETTPLAGGARLSVRDFGPGLPPGQAQDAVRPFVRLAEREGPPGRGLGLAIVQAVAELHDGEFRLEDAAPGCRAVLSLGVKAGSG